MIKVMYLGEILSFDSLIIAEIFVLTIGGRIVYAW